MTDFRKEGKGSNTFCFPAGVMKALEGYFGIAFLVAALLSPVFLFSGHWELSMASLAISTFSAIMATRINDLRLRGKHGGTKTESAHRRP